MPQTPRQRLASDRVAAWLAHNSRNPAWLVDATGADPGTIGDFLNGRRWPKLGTQGKIERALGWPSGSIRQISIGHTWDDVGAVLEPPSEPEVDAGWPASYVAADGDRSAPGTTEAELAGMIREMRELVRDMRLENRDLRERIDRLQGRSND